MSHRSVPSVVAIVMVTGFAFACAENGPTTASPLEGLTRVAANDSGGGAPPPPANPTPGYFRGTILGHGTGPDTMATAPRLANVRVTAYPRLESRTDTLGVGPAAASVLTNAEGEFQLPTLPAGEYIVTINPQAPEDLTYRGAWTIATAHSQSGDHPWWIVLPFKVTP